MNRFFGRPLAQIPGYNVNGSAVGSRNIAFRSHVKFWDIYLPITSQYCIPKSSQDARYKVPV
ncbi:hypothetical protein VKT23_012093 [Stygiomarasmius scandens]|uniref:Uncharacterized protein n=1 Tax=Marasmiellus scandens TaxID=2682957 RepID=A0ABR1J9I3_9AGAR